MTSEPIKTRRARRGDRDALAALLKELGYDEAADSNTLLWVLNHPEIEVIVAVDHLDRPIGFLSLSHRPQLRLRGRIATIDELVVSESWRGKGIGGKLLATGVARARALSVKRIEIATHHGREKIRPSFFEKNGFVEINGVVFRLGELELGNQQS